MSEAQIKFRYFSPSEGHVVARFGTGSNIGASRGPNGFVVNPDMVVPIPVSEIQRYTKEYADALRNKELVERTQQDFDKQQKDVEAQEQLDQEERQQAQRDADKKDIAANADTRVPAIRELPMPVDDRVPEPEPEPAHGDPVPLEPRDTDRPLRPEDLKRISDEDK